MGKQKNTYYLAIDIGASSGCHILGWVENGQIKIEEIVRFKNNLIKKNGQLCWDIDNLFDSIKKGLKKCKVLDKIPRSIGIDTWAVDFVLLDSEDNVIGETVSYRDDRTKDIDSKVYEKISLNDLYSRTGIQKQKFNSIYQLMAIKEANPSHLDRAENFLMIPDYFNFLLTGIKKTEYTNATTTQLVSPITKTWDYDLMKLLGFKKEIFTEVFMPGTIVGELSLNIQREIGFNSKVVLPATHDTASAILSIPSNDDFIYLSSGTWSLMGIERMEADCSTDSMLKNFTNEGGYDYRFRYLKNIMGLWMLQSIKKEYDDSLSFDEISKMAEKESINSIVDCNDEVFLAPDSMIEEVQKYCKKTGQEVPKTMGELASVIYKSLAKSYADTVNEIEEVTGTRYSKINIVGGGSKADYLNKLTSLYTGKKVYAGPTEATAIGNLLAQMIGSKEFDNLSKARQSVKDSFNIKLIN